MAEMVRCRLVDFHLFLRQALKVQQHLLRLVPLGVLNRSEFQSMKVCEPQGNNEAFLADRIHYRSSHHCDWDFETWNIWSA